MTADRSGCAAGKHGDENAVVNHGCSCSDARAERALKQKARRVARLRGPAHVDGVGVARRLQALAAIGWSSEDVAEQLGVTQRAVQMWRAGHYPNVTPRTAATIGQLYDQLQGTAGPSPRSRENATRSRWAPPLLWHDRNIDDPHAEPERDDMPARQPSTVTENVKFLLGQGLSIAEAAARVDVLPESAERALQRARQQAATRAAIERAQQAARDIESVAWTPEPHQHTRQLEEVAS